MRLGTYLGQMQVLANPQTCCQLPPSVPVPTTAKPTRPISSDDHRQERGQLSCDLWHSKLLQSDKQVLSLKDCPTDQTCPEGGGHNLPSTPKPLAYFTLYVPESSSHSKPKEL